MQKHNSNYYLSALLEGNNKVVLEIYKRYYPKVESFVLKNKGEHSDAQDVFQKALLQFTARVRVKQFEIRSTFEAYLYTACKNLWRAELNKRSKAIEFGRTYNFISDVQEHTINIVEQERWELFNNKLTRLSSKCQALLASFFEENDYQTIIEMFGYKTRNSAFQRVFRCKQRLIDLIQIDKKYPDLCAKK